MAMKILILIASLALAVLGAKFERSADRICEPSKEGYYTLDPNDCQKYYICGSTGRAFPKTCAPGFFQKVNDRKGRCTTLENAECGTRNVPDRYSQMDKDTQLILNWSSDTSPVELPSNDNHEPNEVHDENWRSQRNCAGQPNGIYNIPNQCRKYLTCADGVAHVQSCPANLIFDELVNQPGQAGCQWLENTKRTDCSQWEAKDGKPVDNDPESIDGYSNIQPWMNRMDCSNLPDGAHMIPNYCGVYYNCLGGKNLGTQQCPVGTAFEKDDCVYGEKISRTDCAEQQYCKERGAGNHYTRARECDRFMYCSTERGMAVPTNCPPNTIFDLISEHQGLGCVNKDVTKRSECY